METEANDENESTENNILEELGLVQAEERLKKDCIYPLTKVIKISISIIFKIQFC